MRITKFIPLVFGLTLSITSCAVIEHHPIGHRPADESATSAGGGAMGMPPMGGMADAMEDHERAMHEMHEMHEKMMAAKTTEERSKLMAAHMSAMQHGMAMMKEMSAGGAPRSPDEMAAHQQMMERRMETMQMMMQMMMDRLPPAP